MSKSKLIYISVLVLFIIVSCTKDNSLTNPGNDKESNIGTIKLTREDKDVLQKDVSLTKSAGRVMGRSLAHQIRLKYLALSLKDENMGKIIKKEVAKKFDGDYDVLWKMIKNKKLSNGVKLRKQLSKKFNKNSSTVLNLDNIEKVPLLNIAIPVNFDKWDGKEPIKVAYSLVSKEDTEVETITAYDSKLNEYELSAKEVPGDPVIVVGINERVDPKTGTVKYGKNNNSLNKETTPPDGGGGGDAGGGGSSSDRILLYAFELHHDLEPWWKGDAEVKSKVKMYYGGDNGWQGHDFGDKSEGSYSFDPPITIYEWGDITAYDEILIKFVELDNGTNDLLDKKWSTDPSGLNASDYYIPNGILDWYFGKNDNIDIKIITEAN